MNFIRRPESFDVVVGSNLFGDILSDISAIIIGSMGLAASANLDPLRPLPFDVRAGARLGARYRRARHRESAGDDSQRRHDARSSRRSPKRAREVEAAVAAVLAEGKVRTPDLGGRSTHRGSDRCRPGETG